MGMSRFEAMKGAVEAQARMAEAGADDKIQIETLEAELAEIDADTKRRCEEIKATPINKELLEKQAKTERDARLKQNDRALKTTILTAEQAISQAELDAEKAYKQAKLDIDRKKANLVNVKEQAQEIKDRQDIEANEEFERVTASISNVEKTIELRVQKEKIAGEKRKQEIQIRLRGLKAKDKVAEQKKAVFDKFYNDIVEISKQPSQDSN